MNSRKAYEEKQLSLNDLMDAAHNPAAAKKKSSSEPSSLTSSTAQDVVAVEVLATLPVIPALFAPSRTEDEPITLPEEPCRGRHARAVPLERDSAAASASWGDARAEFGNNAAAVPPRGNHAQSFVAAQTGAEASALPPQAEAYRAHSPALISEQRSALAQQRAVDQLVKAVQPGNLASSSEFCANKAALAEVRATIQERQKDLMAKDTSVYLGSSRRPQAQKTPAQQPASQQEKVPAQAVTVATTPRQRAAASAPAPADPFAPLAATLQEAQKKRDRRKRILIIFGVVIAFAVLVGLGIFAGYLVSTSGDEAAPEQTHASAAKPSAPSGATPDTSPSKKDQSGVVVYSYEEKDAAGVTHAVTETVAFDQEGQCATS
ncbi:MAG: hypothetical protein RR866_05375, partial [Raoultibacter sp.]